MDAQEDVLGNVFAFERSGNAADHREHQVLILITSSSKPRLRRAAALDELALVVGLH